MTQIINYPRLRNLPKAVKQEFNAKHDKLVGGRIVEATLDFLVTPKNKIDSLIQKNRALFDVRETNLMAKYENKYITGENIFQWNPQMRPEKQGLIGHLQQYFKLLTAKKS